MVIKARDRVLFSDTSADEQFASAAFSNVAVTGVGNGGNVQIDANSLEVLNGAVLSASTLGTGNAGNVVITARDRVLFNGTSADGQFPSAAASSVEVEAQGRGGNVQISANSLDVLNGAGLTASTSATGDAGNIVIETRGRVLFSNGSVALSRVEGGAVGEGGNVQISANSLDILNAVLSASTSGIGDAGNIVIEAHDRVLLSGASRAFSFVQLGARGRGGNTQIFANSVEVLDGAGLSASTLGTGDAGNVVINARDRVLFDNGFALGIVEAEARGRGGNVQIFANSLDAFNGAQLRASTTGVGDAGNVIVNVRDRVLFNNGFALSSVDAGAQGKGGNVQISANSLDVLNGAALTASTTSVGDAGNVIVNVRDRVLFNNGFALSSVDAGAQGKGGNVQISANSLDVLNGAALTASTTSVGDAGNVIVNVRDRVLFNNGFALSSVDAGAQGKGGNVQISANSLDVLNGAALTASTTGVGDAGNVIVNVRDQVLLDNGSIILSRVELTGVGNGGDLRISTNVLELLNGSQLTTATLGDGNAGDVIINANKRIKIDGLSAEGFPSGVLASSVFFGRAGDIVITTPQLRLDNGGRIDTESAAADGGNITLNIRDLLLMRRGSQISATAGTAQQGGNGGNIAINAPKGFIVGVKSENSDITANAFTGSGGRVNITAQGIFGLQFRPNRTPFSDITASSTFGISGIVTLNTPNVDPSRGLAQLPTSLIDTNRILANSCIVRDTAAGGTFIVTGTGGLPVRPGDAPLPAFPTGEVRGIEESQVRSQSSQPSSSAPSPSSIMEAQGFYKLPDGQVILSWECPRK